MRQQLTRVLRKFGLGGVPRYVIAGIVGAFIVAGVTACVTDESAIGRVVMAMNAETTQLPEKTQEELKRFAQVYDTYVADA